MKRTLVIVICLALLVIVLICPLALAGSCGYRGYGYSAPSYGYGYNSGYGYGSSSTYYGQSYYYPGSYYWNGGYYGGDSHYQPGYYSPGYYDYKSYNGCSYHAPSYPVVPYFPKFESAILVAKFPSYGAYAELAPPERSVANVGYQAGMAQTSYAPAYGANPGYNTGNMVEGKIDRILSVVQETSSEVAALRVRIEVLERTTGIPSPSEALSRPAKGMMPTKPLPGKAPIPPPTPPSTPPTPGTEQAMDGPSIFHTRCASCHDEKRVVSEKSKVVLFVTGPSGPEMATRNDKNEIVALSLGTVKKIKQQLLERTMPPLKNVAGQPVPPMSPEEVQKSLQFLDNVITQAGNAPAPGPAVKP